MFLNSYKIKQGKMVRWGTFIISALLSIFAAYCFYDSFPYQTPDRRSKIISEFWRRFWSWSYESFFSFTIPAVDIPIAVTPRLLFALLLGIILLLVVAYYCFRNVSISDFLIDTDSEMRKVSWPTLPEVVDSSLVVIIVMIALGLYLLVVDIGLNKLLKLFFS